MQEGNKVNFGPIIGILSHPSDGASGRLNDAPNCVHILLLLMSSLLNQLKLNLVNGVLFTGGWAKKGLYVDVVEGIFKHVLKKNDAGEHFPLFAICLGFELISMIISKDKGILERFSGSHHASSLQFLKSINIEGTIFQRFSADLLEKLSTDRLVMHHHKYGISPQTFQENMHLSNFFKILTTSNDKDNKVYVSTVQSRRYPVTAVQWHPEKNAFEWGLSMIPHSDDAIQVTQHFANFFVSEARKSSNRPPVRDVLDNLIYNYTPTYCGKAGKGYDEVYIFTENLARI
ncbi:gamma-glutamyl hydrolase 2-like protein [Tanacetum coccineum]|uniref:folate gamma-glutamyl hydrolase n=1 Tax=Tanacetum coccineum TaxID=301880 RepID=A0ABQ4ZI69_9ASTR